MSVATTQVIMATRTRSFLPRTCTRQVSRRNPLDGAWESFARTRFSWRVVESCFGDVSCPQFNLRLSPVACAMEQDFLGRPPNSDTFLTEMFEQAPSANL
ncbi:hypothetical protein M405DRAFT_329707 [Rhizopogon salebrosus TDB-379]|nr:hypothetical protein M405DRAFT_329707 [Rhizopogon salebrosus TDB-379]